MNYKKIYLAGPISGCSWGESEDWRDRFKQRLKDSAIPVSGFSPLREKGFLTQEKVIDDSYEGTLFSSQRAIMSRDFFDCQTADAVLANFTGSKRVSIGTVMECAWAYQRRIPLIIISEMTADRVIDNMHDHAMLREAANWWVRDEDEAFEVVRALFVP